MIHLGSITEIDGSAIEPVDCITGGSPCQDLSVAGKRAGLAGERSGLFIEQIRVIKEMRAEDRRNGRTNEFIRPRWMVWENVPGAFSSNGGEDFRAVLEETARITEPDAVIPRPPKNKWQPSGCIMGDGWSIAWRVHDAQFWGVPQRRKRISLVADFAGGGAPEVLFERKSMFGDPEESQEKRKGTTGSTKDSTGEASRTISFQERAGKPGGGKGILIQNERTGALSTLNNQAVLDNETVYCLQGNGIDRADTAGCNGKGWRENQSYTLNTIDRPAVCAIKAKGFDGYNQAITGKVTKSLLNAADSDHVPIVLENHPADSRVKIAEDGMVQTLSSRMGTGGGNVPMVMEPMCIGNGQADQARLSDKVGALNCMHDQQAVLTYGVDLYNQTQVEEIAKTLNAVKTDSDHVPCTYGLDRASFNQGQNAQYNFDIREEQAQTLVSKGPGAVKEPHSCVRRLTPLECERLQGFPDNWTDIGEWTDSKGKKHKEADAPRYKALGNSIAIPFWFWLLRRISAEYTRRATLGSLFSGIGGFDICWELCNGAGTARWQSEIEEFLIAVCKRRFGDEATGERGDAWKYINP